VFGVTAERVTVHAWSVWSFLPPVAPGLPNLIRRPSAAENLDIPEALIDAAERRIQFSGKYLHDVSQVVRSILHNDNV
jgi:hypothetical protein